MYNAYNLNGDVLLDIVTPEMYGAVGDGETDDAAAINLALAGGNKIVLFAQKMYHVGSACHIYSNTKIVGCKTKLVGSAFMLGESGDYAYDYDGTINVDIIGMEIDITGVSGADHIIMAHSQNVTVRDCIFKGGDQHSIELNSSKNVIIDNCVFTSISPNRANKEAINIDPASTGYTVNMGYFDDTISDCVKITNCLFENCWSPVGNHNPVTTYPSRNIIFAHNDVRSCYNGLHLFDYQNISIIDNKFFDIANMGVQMTGTKNVHIIGNVFDTVGALVSIEGTDENVIIAENIGNTQAETPIIIGASATNVLVHDNIINDVIVN